MEGGGEPAEILRLKRDLERLASGVEETGAWLGGPWSSPGRWRRHWSSTRPSWGGR